MARRIKLSVRSLTDFYTGSVKNLLVTYSQFVFVLSPLPLVRTVPAVPGCNKMQLVVGAHDESHGCAASGSRATAAGRQTVAFLTISWNASRQARSALSDVAGNAPAHVHGGSGLSPRTFAMTQPALRCRFFLPHAFAIGTSDAPQASDREWEMGNGKWEMGNGKWKWKWKWKWEVGK